MAGLGALAQRADRLPADALVDAAWVASQRIWVLHSGGDSQRLPLCSVRGKAFCSLPACVPGGSGSDVAAPVIFLLDLFQRLTACDLPGVLVAATDVLLHFSVAPDVTWPADGVCGA